MTELNGHLQILNFSAFVALNETKLDKGTPDGKLVLTNYVLVSRRDRREDSKACKKAKRTREANSGGGIALFARKNCASSVVLLEHSETHERSWHTVHTS